MSPSSFQVSSERPFYAQHADAYDALITDPIDDWVESVHGAIKCHGLSVGTVLDAGCGTGRHAMGLLALGHHVELLDASADLLAIARRRCPGTAAHHRDICTLSLPRPFDAVICRGVLNDLVTDHERSAALSCFAEILTKQGILVLDVRENEGSQVRNDGTLRRKKVELESGGQLTFSSRPTWRDGLIQVEEQYDLVQPDGVATRRRYAFRMRPWTIPELHKRLAAAGFDKVEIVPGHGRRSQDRLLVVAQRSVR